MDLIDKVVKKSREIYFVEGFYGNNYLIQMASSTREVKVSYEFLNLLRTSHDEAISIGMAYKKIFQDNINHIDSNLIFKQINWLNEKGMIDLI